MQVVWKGVLGFGMVSIPVRLYAATGDLDVSFHQVHGEDAGRVRYQRVCTACGTEVTDADLVKGVELPSGETMLLTEEDFANLPRPTTKIAELIAFVPEDQVDPLALARGYYLEPELAGRKPYELLRAALEGTQRVGLAKITLRSKESLAVLRPRGNALTLQTMVWPDEVRQAQFDVLDRNVSVSDAERGMATSIIEAMASDFAPEAYRDEYREALLSVIEIKAAGTGVTTQPAPIPSGGLITALQSSVEAARVAGGESVVPEQRAAVDPSDTRTHRRQ